MKGLVKYGIVGLAGCLICFYGHKYKVTKELILNRFKTIREIYSPYYGSIS